MALAPGTAQPLFKVRPRAARLDAFSYDVAADDQRFLVNSFVADITPPITLVVNRTAGP